MIFISTAIILLWFVPWGYFVILPLGLLISISSPASRDEWKEFQKTRIIAVSTIFLLMNLFAFYPVTTPSSPGEWGDPIATENPYASSWPSSEQYTYFYDGAVISVVNTRTPHTFASWGQASSSLALGIMIGFHEERMQQSIEVLNQEFGLSIDSQSFILEEIVTEDSYEYGGNSYSVKRFEIKRLGFETPLGTVLVVGVPSIGGEMSILSITRPAFPVQDDLFEEMIVVQYLENY